MSIRARLAAAIAVALLGVTLTACGAETIEAGSEPDVPGALTESAGPLPSPESPDPVLPAPETGTPTVPPGDPAGPVTAPHDEDHEDLPPRTDIPAAAVLDAETVGAIAGGHWDEVAAPRDSCAAPRPAGALVARTTSLSSDNGLLAETVSIHQDGDAAEAAVAAMRTRLTGCGWSELPSAAVGEADVQLRRTTASGRDHVVMVALEGVTVTLVARGRALDAQDKLAALVDVAVNSSCAAAADGCH